MSILICKAEQASLFGIKVPVKGHATKTGGYVQPHQATRKKKLPMLIGDLFDKKPEPAPAPAPEPVPKGMERSVQFFKEAAKSTDPATADAAKKALASIMTPDKPKATQFESEVCKRCGGSGKFSFNLMHGDVCYGCQGTGRQLTKRGKKAAQFFEDSMTAPVETLVVGQAIRFFATDRKFIRITQIETREEDGRAIVTIDGSTGAQTRRVAGTTVRVMHTPEEKAAKLEAALQYQETLGKKSKKGG